MLSQSVYGVSIDNTVLVCLRCNTPSADLFNWVIYIQILIMSILFSGQIISLDSGRQRKKLVPHGGLYYPNIQKPAKKCLECTFRKETD